MPESVIQMDIEKKGPHPASSLLLTLGSDKEGTGKPRTEKA